jgi:hypothetical protein
MAENGLIEDPFSITNDRRRNKKEQIVKAPVYLKKPIEAKPSSTQPKRIIVAHPINEKTLLEIANEKIKQR